MLILLNIYKKLNPTFEIHVPELQIKGGECVLLMGENGSGKSSLLRIIAGVWHPSRGKIIREYTKQGYLPTDFRMIESMKVSALWKRWERYVQTQELYEKFQIEEIGHLSYGSLSDGQRQRFHLALVLSQNADFYLLDEPTTSLDKHYLSVLIEYISSSPKTFLIATHDNYFVTALNGRVIEIKNGKL